MGHLPPNCLWVSLSLVALGCNGASEAKPSTAERAAPAVHWESGSTHSFDVRMTATSQLVGADAPPWGFALTAGLDLTLVAGAQDGGVQWLRGTLRSPEVTSDMIEGDALGPMESELSLPFDIGFEGGRVVALKISPRVTGQSMALLRTVASSLQVPDGGVAERALEHDATGQYEARYTRNGRQVTRTKLRYLGLHTVGGSLDSSLVPRVLEATATVRLGERQVVQEARVDERYEMTLPTGAKVLARSELTLTATGCAPAAPPSHLADGALEVAADQPFGQTLGRDRFDDVRIGGRTLAQVLDALIAGDGAGDDATMDAFSAVVALARKNPAHVASILARAEQSSQHARRLFDALASAGTPQAQAGLIALVERPGASAEVRRAAARSLIRVRVPTPEQVQLLNRLTRDQDLYEHGIYGLGTAARRLREAGAQARAAAIGQTLASLLGRAEDDAQRMRVLRGIANAADANLLDDAGPMLEHASFGVREAAVFALQRIPGTDVDRALLKRLQTEEHPSVRIALVRAFHRRPPSAEAVAAIERAGKQDPNSHVRYAAIGAMGKWVGGWPGLRPTLEEIGRSDSEPKLQRHAAALLASVRDAG